MTLLRKILVAFAFLIFVPVLCAQYENINRHPTDAKSQIELGVSYLKAAYHAYSSRERDKQKCDQLRTEAVRLFRVAAEQGEPKGLVALGLHYLKETSSSRFSSDKKKCDELRTEAVKLFRAAAEQGEEEGRFALGLYPVLCAEDEKIGEINLHPTDAKTQVALGLYYQKVAYYWDDSSGSEYPYSNHPLSLLRSEATKLFRAAAEQGYPRGQVELGLHYLKVAANTRDEKEGAELSSEALKLFRAAAEQGEADGFLGLGIYHHEGVGMNSKLKLGVMLDVKEAVKWFLKADAQKSIRANAYLHFIYMSVAHAEVGERYFYEDQGRKIVDINYKHPSHYLNSFREGRKDEETEIEAVEWLRKSAEQGGVWAQYALGYYYGEENYIYKETEGARNPVEAAKWFRKAAEQGHWSAQLKLGYCYLEGKGVKKDLDEAKKWFVSASGFGGSTDGLYKLGLCYFEGDGVEKNYAEAIKWFRKAAEQGNTDGLYSLGLCYFEGKGVKKDYAKAVKYFHESGSAKASIRLALCYINGLGVEKNDKKAAELLLSCSIIPRGCLSEGRRHAVKWLFHLAEQGCLHAQLSLVEHYGDWLGGGNSKEGEKWLVKAAAQGDEESRSKLAFKYRPATVGDIQENLATWFHMHTALGHSECEHPGSAMYLLGTCYYNGHGGVEKNYAEATKWYRKAAEQGDSRAQADLGVCYSNGIGVEKNYDEAVKWFRKAAENGSDDGRYGLGLCYFEGKGVKKDYAKAVKYFHESELAKAYIRLALCYINGLGVEKNDKEAAELLLSCSMIPRDCSSDGKEETVKCFRRLAEWGDANEQFEFGLCYLKGSGIKKDYVEAVKWFRRSAEQGYKDGQCVLGHSYSQGIGVKKDEAEAAKWYLKSAKQGNAEGQFNLGLCYFKGLGVGKDHAEAVKWFRKAANQSEAKAQYALGLCYLNGFEVEKDYAVAAGWFFKSAAQGNADGQYSLGVCSFYGLGVEKNEIEALKWLLKSATQGHVGAKKMLGSER